MNSKDQLVNKNLSFVTSELINYEGVYRTAPTTLGVLKSPQ